MVAEAGSRAMRIDEIKKALFPMAGSFDAQVDKEMTTFTGSIHRDKWAAFLDIALPMLLDPGLRAEDFRRLKDAQLNGLKQDLRNNNEEELGKGAPAGRHLRGTPATYPVLGTVGRHRAHHARRRAGLLKTNRPGQAPRLGLTGTRPQGWTRLQSAWRPCPRTGAGRARVWRARRRESNRDHREGHAGHRHLLRPSHRGHAATRLRPALAGPGLVGTAPR
jgi:hypothetical protein